MDCLRQTRSVLPCYRWLLCVSLYLLLSGVEALSQAQVRTNLTPDGTLGTTVTQRGSLYTITGGTRPGNGPNVFHSFDRLSVGTGDTASFIGPAGIMNILSRVTGGQPSEIDGTLRSTIPGAHLYLLNPNGVMFGPNATLDVNGSFHVSTADYLRLADGARFAAQLSTKSTLSIAPPEAFGFLGSSPAPITVRGSTLSVPPGETFSVVGGDITIAGSAERTAAGVPTLSAPGGRMQLASVASAGEVGLPSSGQSLDLEGRTVARLGLLEISEGARVTVRREGNQDAGAVVVRAGILRLTGRAEINSSTQGEGRGGDITVIASEAIQLVEQGQLSSNAFGRGNAGQIVVSSPSIHLDNGRILARTMRRGDGGEIVVRAGILRLTGGAEISSSTRGEGRGGRVTVVAHDVRIDNGQISSTASSQGDGGEITVRANTVTLTGLATPTETFTGSNAPGQLSSNTQGRGRGGHVTVAASDFRMEEGARITARTLAASRGGDGGEIVLRADTVTLTGNANIGSGTRNEGHGGHVTVEAGILRLEETARMSSTTTSSGDGGEIVLRANTVMLTGNTVIDVSTTGSPAIDVSTSRARAGRVTVEADTIHMDKSARITAATGTRTGNTNSGDAGEIVLRASTITLIGQIEDMDRLDVSTQRQSTGRGGRITVEAGALHLENARIEAPTSGSGDGGTIMVQAGTITLTGQSRISSTTQGAGQGGDVTVIAREAIMIAGTVPSELQTLGGIFSQTFFGTGNGGPVTVKTPRLTMIEGGRISAETGGDGRGGDVVIQTGQLTLMSGAQITSGSGLLRSTFLVGIGAGGTVTVTATGPVQVTGPGTGLFTRTAGPGQGGDIMLQAPHVMLTTGATLSAESAGTGNAGNITIVTQDRFLSTGGSVVTRATQADGGNITITAPTLVRLRDSAITAEVGGGGTTVGGNITIDPQFVLLQNSRIVANAFQGRGGNIRIRAQQVFLADPTSRVDASSERGIDGEVAIQAPVTSISGSVAPLPQTFARQSDLLRERCAERARAGAVSRLVLGGRDGVPWQPGNWLASPLEPLPLLHSTGYLRMTPERPPEGVDVLSINDARQVEVRALYAQRLGAETWDVACAQGLGTQPGMDRGRH